jgi:hypothetical protein
MAPPVSDSHVCGGHPAVAPQIARPAVMLSSTMIARSGMVAAMACASVSGVIGPGSGAVGRCAVAGAGGVPTPSRSASAASAARPSCIRLASGTRRQAAGSSRLGLPG